MIGRSELESAQSTNFNLGEEFALQSDAKDPLKDFRREFLFPQSPLGGDCLYFAGNSLGVQPLNARKYIDEELIDWARFGVEGHWSARHPWLPYHENLTDLTARLVGAKPAEVVVMNTLTVNLHLMMVSFYRPTKARYKILIENTTFPSDKYAVDSQAEFHGYAARDAVVELQPRAGENVLRTEDILDVIEKQGDSIAVVLLGQVNYLTGQAFEMERITQAAQAKGCVVGFNLAHGAGNLHLKLHDWNVDFAVWCGYKYLNAGPGALAGCFIHERHLTRTDMKRFAGWWGHDKQTRFKMGPDFQPIPTAEGWQLSNPPIFQLAALRASLEIFDKATMAALRAKSERLTAYLEYMINNVLRGLVTIVTPTDPQQRGCQLSCRVHGDSKDLLKFLHSQGAICDFRDPDILRISPVPLYNRYIDVYQLVTLMAEYESRSKK